MPRYAKQTSLEEFKALCQSKLGIGTEDFDPYEFPDHILKDLAKVNFDFENWCIGNADPSFEKYPTDHEGYAEYPCGYEVLPNGLPVLFMNAGGDWEFPICFVIYWDGKKMRAYIPSDGNIWHKGEKCAYGSDEEEAELEEDIKGDPELIRKDVMSRIIIK